MDQDSYTMYLMQAVLEADAERQELDSKQKR